MPDTNKIPGFSAMVSLKRYRLPDGWTVAVTLIAASIAVPLFLVLTAFFSPGDDVWRHIVSSRLAGLTGNTVVLLTLVLLLTAFLGTSLAWFAAVLDFPGRRWLEWAMVLPFAFPTYVLGYIYLDTFGISGPIQAYLRKNYGQVPGWFPEIQSVVCVALVLSLAFYPYVYLLARAAFRTHGKSSLEAARSLGCTPLKAFFRVTLPMARPWLFGGLMLVAMETLADFGTVAVFNYDTFTTEIYKAWFAQYSLSTASKLAACLLLLAFVILMVERYTRGRQRFFQSKAHETTRRYLSGWRGWLVSAYFLSVLAIAVIGPLIHLAYGSWSTWSVEANQNYWVLAGNTFMIGLVSALLLSMGALLLSYGLRLKKKPWMQGLVTFSTMGYALPGAVLAVGVFVPLSWVDDQLYAIIERYSNNPPDILIKDTVVVMLAAFFVRFLAVAHQPLNASMNRIRPSLDEAARSLGHSRMGVLRAVHLPMLRAGLFSAMLLVMIDVMKEMPITLMTRPFGWEMLSIRIFELTSEGEYERAALPSALLVLAGMIPVILLAKYSGKQLSGENES